MASSSTEEKDLNAGSKKGDKRSGSKHESKRSSDDENKKKSDKKKAKREASGLETEEHVREVKRLRTYSKDLDGDSNNGSTKQPTNDNDKNPTNQRRRTRSVDLKEEVETAVAADHELSTLEWRKEHSITIKGHGAKQHSTIDDFAEPFRAFRDAPFSDTILTAFERAGFARPTPIQSQSWPIALQGSDLICIAKTGSGKTCGFLLPYFHKCLQKRGPKPRGHNSAGPATKPTLLVLAPTRELSVQIQEEAQKFGRPLGIRSLCCYGGTPKYPQIQSLQRGGVECLIATPGRLNDLLEMKKVDLSQIEFLVLDEVSSFKYC